ncbi:hypothetical protein D3C76_799690 [compost metagenome]
MRSPEPALLKGVVGAPEAITFINEPHLPPKVLEAIRAWRTGQQNDSLDLGVRNPGQCFGAARTLAQPEAFELGSLVDYHCAERPLVAEVFDQPFDLLEVDGVHVCLDAQCRLPILERPADRHHAAMLEVVPLLVLLRPSGARNAKWRDDKDRVDILGQRQVFQRSGRADGLAQAHPGPHGDTLGRVDRRHDQVLIFVRSVINCHYASLRLQRVQAGK